MSDKPPQEPADGASEEPAEKVGPGKPPRHTRFNPGQSGNRIRCGYSLRNWPRKFAINEKLAYGATGLMERCATALQRINVLFQSLFDGIRCDIFPVCLGRDSETIRHAYPFAF